MRSLPFLARSVPTHLPPTARSHASVCHCSEPHDCLPPLIPMGLPPPLIPMGPSPTARSRVCPPLLAPTRLPSHYSLPRVCPHTARSHALRGNAPRRGNASSAWHGLMPLRVAPPRRGAATGGDRGAVLAVPFPRGPWERAGGKSEQVRREEVGESEYGRVARVM